MPQRARRLAVGGTIGAAFAVLFILTAHAATPSTLTQSQVWNAPFVNGAYQDFALNNATSGAFFILYPLAGQGVWDGSIATYNDGSANYANLRTDLGTQVPPASSAADVPTGVYNFAYVADWDGLQSGDPTCANDLQGATDWDTVVTDCAGSVATYGISYDTFTVTADATPGTLAMSFPTSIATQPVGYLGRQLEEPGTLDMVVLVIGLPLFFYAVEQIIGLFPRNKKGRRG